MQTLKRLLMKRDSITEAEAEEMIAEGRELLYEYLDEDDTESAYEVCSEMFGLEPDYLMELI